jgi:hypothetical protein
MISPGGLLSVVGKCEEVHNGLMDWLGKLQQWMNPSKWDNLEKCDNR